MGMTAALAVISGLPLATFPLILFLRGRAADPDDLAGEPATA